MSGLFDDEPLPPEPPPIDGPVFYQFVMTEAEVRLAATGALPERIRMECAECLPWLDGDVAEALQAMRERQTKKRRVA